MRDGSNLPSRNSLIPYSLSFDRKKVKKNTIKVAMAENFLVLFHIFSATDLNSPKPSRTYWNSFPFSATTQTTQSRSEDFRSSRTRNYHAFQFFIESTLARNTDFRRVYWRAQTLSQGNYTVLTLLPFLKWVAELFLLLNFFPVCQSLLKVESIFQIL